MLVSVKEDRDLIRSAVGSVIDTETVARFVPGPGLQKLSLRFDPAKLNKALDEVLARANFKAACKIKGLPPSR